MTLAKYTGADNQLWLLNADGLQGFAGYCFDDNTGNIKAGDIGGLFGEIVEVSLLLTSRNTPLLIRLIRLWLRQTSVLPHCKRTPPDATTVRTDESMFTAIRPLSAAMRRIPCIMCSSAPLPTAERETI